MPHASVCICVSEGGSRAGGEGLFEARPAARKPAFGFAHARETRSTCVSDWLDARSEQFWQR